MKFYPTPPHIADLVKKHLPKDIHHVLEPAVGEGALLAGLSSRSFDSVTIVDLDSGLLRVAKRYLPKVKSLRRDYLLWSRNSRLKFDLIITNPPFSAKSSEFIEYDGQRVPIEVAFIDSCLKQMTVSGTLIGIVPGSIINSGKWARLRQEMLSMGEFTHVYQLPKNTFHKIEAVFYLFVYKKDIKGRQIILRKFKSDLPDIALSKKVFPQFEYRLDFDFYSSFFKLNKIISFAHKSEVFRLGSIVKLKRGSVRVQYKDRGNIHSTHLGSLPGYISGKKGRNDNPEKQCIGLKRVSRNAHLSFSILSKSVLDACTDCVIIIASRTKDVDILAVLFSLRIIYSNDIGESVLMKGIGARYISVEKLAEIPLVDLSNLFHEQFLQYKAAFLERDYIRCKNIEDALFHQLCYGRDIHSIQKARLGRAAMQDREVSMQLEHLSSTTGMPVL